MVKFQLKTVPGVTDILSIGGHVLQYQIRVDPDALLRYHLSLDDLDRSFDEEERNLIDETGRFTISVPEGQWRLRFYVPGYVPVDRQI